MPLLANFCPQYGQIFSFSPVCVWKRISDIKTVLSDILKLYLDWPVGVSWLYSVFKEKYVWDSVKPGGRRRVRLYGQDLY